MKLSRTTALTGYFCKNFSSRITQSHLLLTKDEPEIPQDLSLWRRPICQTLSKALDMSSATARVAPDLLKIVAILSDRTTRRSAVFINKN